MRTALTRSLALLYTAGDYKAFDEPISKKPTEVIQLHPVCGS